jgi:hypothetical protein
VCPGLLKKDLLCTYIPTYVPKVQRRDQSSEKNYNCKVVNLQVFYE